MPKTYRYQVRGTVTLKNTGNAIVNVYVGLKLEENDVLGRIARATINPVMVELRPNDSKTVTLQGVVSLRSALKHRAVFVVALDSNLRNVITTATTDFTPQNPFLNKVRITGVSQSGTNLIVGVSNSSGKTKTVYVGVTLATRVAGSGCNLYIPSGAQYKDLPLKTATIYAGGSTNVTFTLTESDLQNYDYAIVKVWDDDPSKYDRRVAWKLCLDGTAKQLMQIRYGAQILSANVSNGVLYVTVKNTGNVGKYYWIGASVIEQGKYGGSGCNLYVTGGRVWDLPPKAIGLQAGQSGTVTIQLPTLPVGNYQVIVKVWHDYDRNTNRMLPPCYDGKVTQPFSITPSVSVSSSSVTVTPY